MRRIEEMERRLRRRPAGTFQEGELDGLPEPARRALRTMLAPGTPLARSARISMHGRIRIRKWTRFTATEVIAPHEGFTWHARAGPISGYDRYVEGEGEMRWRLFGLLPVMRAAGSDVSRSALGRLAGETLWLPTGLLPRFGVEWRVIGDDRLAARCAIEGREEPELQVFLDEHARIRWCRFDRWGDPDDTGTHALHAFGMEAGAYREFSGMTIPSSGRAGWHHGTERWEEGVFFEYEIDALRPHL